jgi:Ankyrin repeats (3 copies)/Ankyrin repeats (many copies)
VLLNRWRLLVFPQGNRVQNVSAYLDYLGADKLSQRGCDSTDAARVSVSETDLLHSLTGRPPAQLMDDEGDLGTPLSAQAAADEGSSETPAVEARVWFSVVPPSQAPSQTSPVDADAEEKAACREPVLLKECAHRFTTPDNDWGFRELLPVSQARTYLDDSGALTLQAHLVVHSKTFTAVRDRVLAASSRWQRVDWIEIVRLVNLHGPLAATAMTKCGIAVNNDQALLIQAACKTHIDYCKLLIERGASLDVVDSNGRGPLFYAARAGRRDIVEWLVRNGVEMDTKDSDGRSAIFYACEEGCLSTVEFLLAEGAEFAAVDIDGDTPARLAESRGHDNIAAMLRALQSE